jgi:hypothetical protein
VAEAPVGQDVEGAAAARQIGLDSAFLFCSCRCMELLFKIVEVAPSGDRVIAAADNLAVARAAYDTAVALWPTTVIELRQKARVRRGSSPEAAKRCASSRRALRATPVPTH